MKKTIYLLPGVGCDESVFRHLELPDWEVVPIMWLTPKKDEKLKEYVKRLLPQIRTDTEPVFIGLSFGGIVSIELSKLIKAHKVILISSIKTHYERPYKMSMLYLLKFYRMFPATLAVRFGFWHRWALGDLNDNERELVNDMIKKVDIKFNKWAVDQAIHWENKNVPDNLVHIHGDNDNIFPHIYVRDYHRIEGGTHFMIVRHARQISHIIKKELGLFEEGKPVKSIRQTPKPKPAKEKSKVKRMAKRFVMKVKDGMKGKKSAKGKKMRA